MLYDFGFSACEVELEMCMYSETNFDYFCNVTLTNSSTFENQTMSCEEFG